MNFYRVNIILSLLLSLLKGLELLFTLLAIPLGAIEVHPIGVIIINNSFYCYCYFLLILIVSIAVNYYFYKKNMLIFSKILFGLLISISIITLIFLINNTIVFYQLYNI